MKVLLFAGIAEAVGQSSVELQADESFTVRQLKDRLSQMHPEKELDNRLELCFAAVNNRYCTDDTDISGENEVALIPPVSGG